MACSGLQVSSVLRVESTEEQRLAQLVFGHRWGALATTHDNRPLASYVAYVAQVEGDGFLIHVSRLARHTTNLLANLQASLAISEADNGTGDPQTLARVTLQGSVTEVARGSADYEVAQGEYLQALPDAEQLFGFADFVLFKLTVEQVRFVAGFGKSYTLSCSTLQRVRRDYDIVS